jgi:hypothetical protein
VKTNNPTEVEIPHETQTERDSEFRRKERREASIMCSVHAGSDEELLMFLDQLGLRDEEDDE